MTVVFCTNKWLDMVHITDGVEAKATDGEMSTATLIKDDKTCT